MTTGDDQDLVALGVIPAGSEDADISDRELAWATALGPLDAAAERPAPAHLWERIAARLTTAEAVPGSRTLGVDDGVWETVGAGVERKLLMVDRGSGESSYYIRMAAGARLPRHRHSRDEHCVVLSGELEIAGQVFGAGVYHFVPSGVIHPVVTAHSDALFFICGALD